MSYEDCGGQRQSAGRFIVQRTVCSHLLPDSLDQRSALICKRPDCLGCCSQEDNRLLVWLNKVRRDTEGNVSIRK